VKKEEKEKWPSTTSAHKGRHQENRENAYAIPAAYNIEMKPAIIALGLICARRRVRDGATGDNTQVCMPSVPMFANPHRAHEAIVNPRVDRNSAMSSGSMRGAPRPAVYPSEPHLQTVL